MKKRATVGLLVLTAGVMGSLWAHDVALADASTASASDKVVQVEADKRAVLSENADLAALLEKSQAEVMEQKQALHKQEARTKKAKAQRDEALAQAKDARALAEETDAARAAAEKQVTELTAKVKDLEPEMWHGFVVGEVVVCPASDWIVSVDTTADGNQWGACM